MVKYSSIERELVVDKDVDDFVAGKQKQMVLSQLENGITSALSNEGIEADEVTLASGNIELGEGARTAAFNVKTVKGDFMVGIGFDIDNTMVKVSSVNIDDVKAGHGFKKYMVDVGEDQYVVTASSSDRAVGIVVENLFADTDRVTFKNQTFTAANKIGLMEALMNDTQVVPVVETKKTAAINVERRVEMAPVKPLMPTSTHEAKLHPIESRIGFDVDDVVKEVGRMKTASVVNQVRLEIENAIKTAGVSDYDIDVSIKEITETGVLGTYEFSTGDVEGKFEFTASLEDGVVSDVDVSYETFKKFSGIRTFEISLDGREFQIVAKDERTACRELLETLMNEGPVKIDEDLVTASNIDFVAEKMVKKVALRERNVHVTDDTFKEAKIGHWTVKRDGDKVVVEA
jgi:hypothetical protein